MKFYALSTLICAWTFPSNVDAQATYACPSAGSISLSILPADGVTTIRLPRVSPSNGLCLIVRRNASSGGERVAASRSYAGRDWERSAGALAKTGSGVVVDCTQGSAMECDVTLPALDQGFEYILESHTYGISEEAEATRFLEQATFGATRETIDAMTASSNDFASWVEDQLALPVGSHREFYRSHTNPKFEFAYKVGATGPRPCELHSRWRRYALSSLDGLSNRKTGWSKHLTVDLIDGKYIWKVDGSFRTVTTTFPIGSVRGTEYSLKLGHRYKILHQQGRHWVADCVGCPISVQPSSGDDSHIEIKVGNPEVSVAGIEGNASILPFNVVDLPVFKSNDLPTIENADDYPLFSDYVKPFENALLNTTALEGSNQCDGFPTFRKPFPLDGDGSPPGYFPTVFGRSADGVVFAYDPHLSFYENTVDNPLMDGGGQLIMDTYDVNEVAGKPVLCQNVERHSLNEDGCKLSFEPNVCSPQETPNEVIEITEANLSGIKALTGRKLYALTSLPFTDDVDSNGRAYLKKPCVGSTSRWVRRPDDAVCANTANLGETTLKTFSDLISSRGMRTDIDYNPNVVDVFRNIRGCDAADDTKLELGNVRAGDGSCWKHVHPLELSVLDLTSASTTKYTKISGSKVTINDMAWLYGEEDNGFSTYTNVGILDDHVPANNAPSPLSDAGVQDTFKSLDLNPSKGPKIVCGSVGEVASDPFNGDYGFTVVIPEGTGYRNWGIHDYSAQRHTVWTTLALKGVDQLRQKMAWNLSQIIAVGLPGSGGTFNEVTEHYIAFYDMFVNHAFGNYRELMKEFSYNLIMGKWLDYQDNKSLQYNIEKYGTLNHPDENFAREIMQLFSLGLYKLNMDGTYIMKENGLVDETYSFDDIVSYARAWTGLSDRNERGGVSVAERQWNDKIIDPMRMKTQWRDMFPKNNLQDGYIGDHVALCEDLPDKHFLRKGATYYALGSKPNPEFQHDSEAFVENPDYLRLRVLPSSPLYAKLCASDTNGDCTLPSKVVLDENLAYDAAAMLGDEFAVDTIRTVELSVGLANPIYYEYVRQPCVELSFFDNAKKVTQGVITSNNIIGPSFCGNPNLSIATPMCASSDSSQTISKIYCHYQGERVTYTGAEALCAANGEMQSHPSEVRENTSKSGPCVDGISASFHSWANAWCSVQVKIDFESGYTAIVNEVEPDHAGTAQVEPKVSSDTLNFFKTYWADDIYPSDMNACLNLIAGGASCEVHEGKYCICDTTVVDSAVFASADSSMSIDQLLTDLRTGAVDPSTFDAGTYNSLNCGIEGVTVYSKSGDCSSLASDSIFAFTNKSKAYFLKNMHSNVHISGSNDYSFRNPVQFINLVDPEIRDMHYEVDAVLDSLFYHPTHPPFMATRIVQRFGISNPSPAFIERVATAYATGSYDNGRFGSGSYGDLGALVAAILLDDETRKPVLDSDPAHGHIREPLVKVLSFFRSMGVSFDQPLSLSTLMSLESRIGQGSYEAPSVFSFFLSEYTPNVPALLTAGLVAPESMVLSGDNLLELHEGIFGLVKFGLKGCYADSLEGYRVGLPWSMSCNEEGDTETAPAHSTYWPPSTASVDDILDDLSMLLTSGRLTPKNRAVIKSAVEPEFTNGNIAKSIRMAQQLLFATPEFHSTSVTRNSNDVRELSGYIHPPAAPYKAVVLLMMLGGADSWNLLVPYGNCAEGNQYQEYKNARGSSHAVPLSDLVPISAASSEQNCDTFGVTKDLDYLAELYNNGEAIFFPNTGILAKTVTKHDDWNGETPFQLGAHNSMVHEFYRNDAFNERPNSGVFGRMLDQLKLRGYQTAANAAGAGSAMLTGDTQYNHPIRGVTTKVVDSLNKIPTVENIYDIVKELNGVGQHDNGVMSEAWSSKVASGLFEHEEAIEFAQLPQFSDHTYPGEGSLNSRFGSVMKSMKSREYRKVNREFYVVKHEGYDHHGSNDVSGKFKSVDDAITNFVSALKSNDLWESTVLVMGSDFGRSLNPNSSGGSDHAWGGNYFMVGGSVKGGKILGRYPQPLTPDHPNWIGRGRFIPTTSWDAVWNGIGQWMGLHDEDELNEAIPNRNSFDTCTELFTDKDLFLDGACTCSGCETVTWPPTIPLTSAPTQAPRTIYQAEDQSWDASGKVSSGNSGWTGEGYANMGGKGSWVEFNTVDGGAGGACTLGFHYSVGASLPRSCTLKINGVDSGTVTFSSTASWDAWKYDYVETTCLPGNNVIRVTASTGEGGPNLDRMDLLSAPTSAPPPTSKPTFSVPTNLPTPKPSTQPTSSPTPLPTPPTTPQPSSTPTTAAPTTQPGPTVNLALHADAFASQHSTCNGGEAIRAIDGNTNCNWKNGSVMQTCTGRTAVPAWWMVDLGVGKQHTITSVSVYNRCDGLTGQEKILNSNVEILDDAYDVVATQSIGSELQAVYTFDFGGVQGRFVRVIKTENGNLNIAEVEVMGTSSTTGTQPTPPPTSLTPPPTFPITPLPTSQPISTTAAPTKPPTPQPSAPPTSSPTPLPTPVPSAQPINEPSPPSTPLPTSQPGPTANLALHADAFASQHSTCNGGEAIRAIDGNTNCNWKNGSVMQTCTGRTAAPAWWMVDLGVGKQHTITSVSVYNRCDGLTGQEKILNSNVEILDDAYDVVATQSIGSELQAVYTFDFGGVQGRFVRVIKTENGNLNIAEVEVMGTSSTTGTQPTPPPTSLTPPPTFPITPLPTSQPISTTAAPTKPPTPQPSAPPTSSPTPLPTPVPSAQPINEPSPPSTPLPTSQPGPTANLALHADAFASQHSTCNGGEAIRAIDGNTNCNWKNGSVMQTCTGRTAAPAWWMVDLGVGKQHTITSVSVYNRCDGLTGQEKILNSNVEILDDAYDVVATQSIGSELQAVYTFDFGGVQGRFVRVIKTENGNLNIAEVEVMGTSSP